MKRKKEESYREHMVTVDRGKPSSSAVSSSSVQEDTSVGRDSSDRGRDRLRTMKRKELVEEVETEHEDRKMIDSNQIHP
jgi:hypothetical protein